MGDKLPQFALSIRQPWAWCILHCGKDIENRSWPTRFRGTIALHAAKGLTAAEYEDCLARLDAISVRHQFPPGLTMPTIRELRRGGIVGTVDVVDCVSQSDSPWFFGRYGFRLANPRPVDFITVTGALGVFDWRQRLKGKHHD